jgi:hypothetical protein
MALLPPSEVFNLNRFGNYGCGTMEDTREVHVVDFDTRHDVLVTLPNPDGFMVLNDDLEGEIPIAKAIHALSTHLDDLPPETVAVELDETGKLLSFNTNPELDRTYTTDYFSLGEYQLPPQIADRTVLRSELTEMRRFQLNVDLVSYPASLSPPADGKGEDRYVFKYETAKAYMMWREIHMVARLPPHPSMVLLDRVVLDEMTGSKVVGFTARYVAAKNLAESRPPFKLKWLKQLMQAVDDLNLKHGIIHQDIAHRNLLIDPDTDSIILIDFGLAARIGLTDNRGPMYEGTRNGRDDVRGVLVFLYEYITRDPALETYILHRLNEKDFTDPAKWIKHPDVELDHDTAEFYIELMTWVRGRRAGKAMAHYTEAPEPLDWPSLPERARAMEGGIGYRIREGLPPHLDWKRPATAKIDPTRRLLATGRYADEEEAAQKAAAQRAAEYNSAAAAAISDPFATALINNETATANAPSSNLRRSKRIATTNADPTALAAAPDTASDSSAAASKGARHRRRAPRPRAERDVTPLKRK